MIIQYLIYLLLKSLVDCSNTSTDEGWYRVHKVAGIDEWVELKNIPNTKIESLCCLHLGYKEKDLPFHFPFYGEEFSSVKVTTQGFIGLSEWLSDTQYIGPLIANFKPSPKSNKTQDIRAVFYPHMAIFQWSNMLLSDQTEEGEFEFQLHIIDSGEIRMLYKTIPIPLQKIKINEHVVRAGISGGHPYGQKVRLPYSVISLKKIKSNITYVLKPVSTCMDKSSCSDCLGFSDICGWCSQIQKCSSGLDKFKIMWTQNGCGGTPSQDCLRKNLPPTPYAQTTESPTSMISTHSYSHADISTTEPFNTTSKDDQKTYRNLTTEPWNITHTNNKVEYTDNNSDIDNNNIDSSSNDKSYTIGRSDKRITTPHPPAPSSNLSAIYVILIAATVISLIFIVSALLILCNHKRRYTSSTAIPRSSNSPERNNLIRHDVGEKC